MQKMHPDRFFLYFLSLTVVLFVIYSNTLNSPWILDDKANIIDNTSIHLQEISWQSVKNTFHAYPDSPGKLYRPVSCFSFALNWFFGQDNPSGYHIVNIVIHISTAFFLYLVCLHFLKIELNANNISVKHIDDTAFLAALLWAVNPMQTQAVTYIVQRMAALAAMFSIIGIFFFIKARTVTCWQKKILFSILCLLSFLLAIGSKENAVIFPFSLILIEVIFFKTSISINSKTKIVSLLTVVLILLIWNIIGITIPGLNYEHRNFTLLERALTSPRIIFFYLSLLFFPSAERLSLEHDILISKSIFYPYTTILSILFLSILFFLSIFLYRKKKVLSFSILFFLINHGVESSVLNIELIFEHRNYLPSLFLFLPLSKLTMYMVSKDNFFFRSALFSLGVILTVFFSFNTYKRNQTWSSSLFLWQDAYNKAPNSSRAAINLAKEYFYTGDIETSLVLSRKSYNMWQPTKNYAQALSLNAQGVIANASGRYQDAVIFFKKSLKFVPDYGEAKNNLILVLCKQYKFNEASLYFDGKNKNLEGIILLWNSKYEESLTKFINIQNQEAMLGIGKSLSKLGYHEKADIYLRNAAAGSALGRLLQIENLILSERIEDAYDVSKKMFFEYKASDIFDSLLIDDTRNIPLDRELIIKFVVDQFQVFLL